MKINKEKLKSLSALSDGALWKEIRTASEKFGFILPEAPPDEKDMAKIRSAMADADKMGTMELLRLMSVFKQKNTRG